MHTDLLTLTQWMSPAFPLGSFAYSHGLETAISEGHIQDAATLQDWLALVLEHGAGWTDAILLVAAHRGEVVADLARAIAGSAERLEETLAQGTAFAETVSTLGQPQRAAPLPVAVGEACRALALDSQTIAGVYLQNFMSNLVTCAVRFVPLGQTEGQAVLGALAPHTADTARRATEATLDDLGSGAFFSDISAMAHEAQAARVYRT